MEGLVSPEPLLGDVVLGGRLAGAGQRVMFGNDVAFPSDVPVDDRLAGTKVSIAIRA